MRLLRALSLGLALVLALSSTSVAGPLARAQTVDEAQEDAIDAAREADQASALVDEAVANRAAIELELMNTISKLNDLAAELSTLSVGLDRISQQLGFADIELADIETDIENRAVDAYMSALSGTPMTLVNSQNVEQALVTGLVVQDLVSSDQEAIDGLVFKKKGLEELINSFARQKEAVAAKQAEFDSESEHLAELFDEADQEVAAAVREANAADAAHRAALAGVEAAKAKVAQDERQEPTTTTTDAPSTTTPPGTGTTTTTTPPATTTTTSSGGGGYPFDPPPAVEQWRGLVSQHFPSNRVDEALHIIWCESRGDPDAYNPYSGASGLFQFIPSTWASTAPAAGYPGASPFEPVANVASAAWLANRYQELGQYYWQAWNCKRVLP